MKNKQDKSYKNSLKYKIAVFVIYALLIAALTVALIPLAKLLTSENGMEKFHNILESYRYFGIVVFLLVQAIQVVVVFIPPVQIVGGMLFGGIFGSILSVVGLWLGSAAVFWLVRTAGKPLVEAIISKKDIKKFKFLEDGEKLTFVLFVLYLIPGTPKDALTYLAGLTKIDTKQFLFVVLPARVPMVVVSAVFGSSINSGNYALTVVLALVIAAFAVFGFIFREKAVERMRKFIKRKKL